MAARHPNNLYLTGFMGAGKSTVGPLVADLLDWEYVDTDELIEEASELSIAEFFATLGEPAFREVESKMLEELAGEKKRVVALGGGALTSKGNQKTVLSSGVLVYLKATIPTLVKRLETMERPLLTGLKGEALFEKIEELLERREPVYHLANFTIVTDGKTPKEVAKEVADGLKAWGK